MGTLHRVLLVDDDKTMNFLSQLVLKEMDAAEEVRVALDGQAACELIETDDCPDVIFLDIRMPRMDGFEFLEILSTKGKCKDVKVVMLTSSTRPEDQQKAFAYENVVEYFEKPLTEESVRKVVNKYFA